MTNTVFRPVGERVTLRARMLPDGLVDALLAEARASNIDLARLGVAWARVLPTALFLPAFGLGFLTFPVRAVIALGLALALAPSIPVTPLTGGGPWLAAVLGGLARGVPVALVASVSLWAALVAGGVADTAIGSARLRTKGTPLATLLGLFAAVAFFELGGATRLVTRLAEDGGVGLQAAVADLAAGVTLGAAIGAPFLVVALVIDVATGVAGREGAVSEGQFAAARSLVLSIASAAFFERVAEAIAVFGGTRP